MKNPTCQGVSRFVLTAYMATSCIFFSAFSVFAVDVELLYEKTRQYTFVSGDPAYFPSNTYESSVTMISQTSGSGYDPLWDKSTLTPWRFRVGKTATNVWAGYVYHASDSSDAPWNVLYYDLVRQMPFAEGSDSVQSGNVNNGGCIYTYLDTYYISFGRIGRPATNDFTLKPRRGFYDENDLWHPSDDPIFDPIDDNGYWKRNGDKYDWIVGRRPSDDLGWGIKTNDGVTTWQPLPRTNNLTTDNAPRWIWSTNVNDWVPDPSKPLPPPDSFLLSQISMNTKATADVLAGLRFTNSTSVYITNNLSAITASNFFKGGFTNRSFLVSTNGIGDFDSSFMTWTQGYSTVYYNNTNVSFFTNRVGVGPAVPTSIGSDPIIELGSDLVLFGDGPTVIDMSKYQPHASYFRLMCLFIVWIRTFWAMYRELEKAADAA